MLVQFGISLTAKYCQIFAVLGIIFIQLFLNGQHVVLFYMQIVQRNRGISRILANIHFLGNSTGEREQCDRRFNLQHGRFINSDL